MDNELQLDACLSQTTVDAAAAGLHLLDFITSLSHGVTWSLHHGRIHFSDPSKKRSFCTLRPTKSHITCNIPSLKTAVRLTTPFDVDAALQAHIQQAYQQTYRH